MKVKIISRNPNTYQRETTAQRNKMVRNFNLPKDPFRAQTEYTRALNATKLNRVFAKPFVASLDGHLEGVNVLAKHSKRPSTIVSGARDGQVKIWNLPTRSCVGTAQAHQGLLNAISVDQEQGDHFVTVGQDCQLKYWRIPVSETKKMAPVHNISLNGIAYGASHLAHSSDFVTCGDDISVWKVQRDTPLKTYSLGHDTIHTIKANPIEESVMVGAMADRSIFTLDTRQDVPLQKVTMKLRPNAISWNPMEAYTFTVASEDYTLYTFDLRNFGAPVQAHTGFTSAVTDVDYSPTGQEFVAGSFDRTVRIYNAREQGSRDVYHTKRMNVVLSVLWSSDSKFVLSGSNEMNVRVWKANSAEKLGPLTKREKDAFAYNEKLRETYKHHPEIRKIERHRHVPKHVHSAAAEHKTIRDSKSRKAIRMAKSQGNGEEEVPHVPQVMQAMVSSSK